MSTRAIAILFLFSFLGATNARAQVGVCYDPSSGNLSVHSEVRTITTFEMKAGGDVKFIPTNINEGTLFPPFDLITPDKLFKLSAAPNDYLSIDFGNVLPPGMSLRDFDQFTIVGSLTPDGSGNNSLDANGLVIPCIPEPSGLTLLGLAGAAFVPARRRRRKHFR